MINERRENIFYLDQNKNDKFEKNRNKEKIKVLKENLKMTENVEEADYILSVGGDGSLLRSISLYKHLNKPFFGINGGTLGYYMQHLFDENNKIPDIVLEDIRFKKHFNTYMPLLSVKAIDDKGVIYTNTAFGDVWVERAVSQSLKYNISVVTDTVPLFCSKDKAISGDGILFSTAAGSTGYARSILGVIMPIGSKNMLVAPMNSSVDKRLLNGFTLNSRSKIKIDICDYNFRIPKLSVDGQTVKNEDGSDFKSVSLEVSSSDEKVVMAFIEQNYIEYKSFDYLIN